MAFKVFLSHSVSDLGIVYQLKNWLDLNEIETYLAELEPQPGAFLSEKIASAIDKSNCLIAVITRDGVRSPWVNQEIGYAKKAGKLIIPVIEEGASLSGFIEGVEYIRFDRYNPMDAISEVVDYLSKLKVDKEWRELAVAGLLIFFGLLALAAFRRR